MKYHLTNLLIILAVALTGSAIGWLLGTMTKGV